jgi:hypothetical protein
MKRPLMQVESTHTTVVKSAKKFVEKKFLQPSEVSSSPFQSTVIPVKRGQQTAQSSAEA